MTMFKNRYFQIAAIVAYILGAMYISWVLVK